MMKQPHFLTCAAHSVLHYGYFKVSNLVFRRGKADSKDVNTALWGKFPHSAVLPKVAFLCDEMTWQDYSQYCNAIFLHPQKWKAQLEAFQPELFFCEAAWSGIQLFENVWRGQIYRDHRIFYENREKLLQILAYCHDHGIITAFWGKEDPTFFQHKIYDFTDTALRFDTIFTTDAACIERYNALGHDRVFVLPFGVDTSRFYPGSHAPAPDTVLFAGSWFADQSERCHALQRLLDYSIAQGWKLDIFDRKYGTKRKQFQFPQKYNAYIRPPVSYEKTAELYRQYEYAINVNTVVDSPTMCSRRLLQLAVSGNTILSNHTAVFSTLSDCLELHPVPSTDLIIVKGNPLSIERTYALHVHFDYILQQCRLSKEKILHGAAVV